MDAISSLTSTNSQVLVSKDSCRPRVIVSTDIGGSDFDDFQSLVHLLLYSDILDIEGLISSPWGEEINRKKFLLEVIEHYSTDYPCLKAYSQDYPEPEYLKSICKQGAKDSAGFSGFGKRTEGSDWIIHCAKSPDPRPLWFLGWAVCACLGS